MNDKIGKSVSEGLPSSKMKIKKRENTLSLTDNLDQMGRAEEVFERLLMQPFSARCNIIRYKKTSRIPLVVYALSSIVYIPSLACRVFGKEGGVAPLIQIGTVPV